MQRDFVEPGAVDDQRLARRPSRRASARCCRSIFGSATPSNCTGGRAGLMQGPSKFMTVRTCRAAGGPAPHASSRDGRRARTGSRSRSRRAARAPFRATVDLRAQRLEHVGRAAARADAAIAVLGDRQAAAAATKAVAVETLISPDPSPPVPQQSAIEIIGPFERQRGGDKRARGADHLLGGLALHAKGDQHAGDLGRLEPAEHEPLEQMLGVFDRQVFAGEQLGQRIGDRDSVRRVQRRRRAAGAAASELDNLVMEIHLKQKSPPSGGRAVDDRWLVDQSRHRAARVAPHHQRRAVEGCGDGVQVRHANRVVRQGLARRSTRSTVDAFARRQWHGPRSSGCSSMVEQKPSKLTTRVQFPSPAPKFRASGGW